MAHKKKYYNVEQCKKSVAELGIATFLEEYGEKLNKHCKEVVKRLKLEQGKNLDPDEASQNFLLIGEDTYIEEFIQKYGWEVFIKIYDKVLGILCDLIANKLSIQITSKSYSLVKENSLIIELYGYQRFIKEYQLDDFLKQFYPTIMGICINKRKQLGIDADELFQESLLKACKGLEHFREGSNFISWIAIIINRLAWDRFEKQQKELAEISLGDITEKDLEANMHLSTLDGELFSEEMKEKLSAAIEQLSDEHRTVIVLSYYQGWSNEVIAEELGMCVGTIKSRKFRATGELKKILKKEPTNKFKVIKSIVVFVFIVFYFSYRVNLVDLVNF